MPGGDRTGPGGEGPMTGRQLGYGAGYDSPGFTRAYGRRCGWGPANFGRGRGRGYFWRGQVDTPADIPDEAIQLNEMNSIRKEMEELKDRVSSLLKTMSKKGTEKK